MHRPLAADADLKGGCDSSIANRAAQVQSATPYGCVSGSRWPRLYRMEGNIAMKGVWSVASGLLVLSVLGGCKTTAKPSLTEPRGADVQQKRALRYDPYPDTNAGPAMTGVRPRDYDIPPAETTRARWERDPATNATRWGTQGNE